jgi:hypothetical protein
MRMTGIRSNRFLGSSLVSGNALTVMINHVKPMALPFYCFLMMLHLLSLTSSRTIQTFTHIQRLTMDSTLRQTFRQSTVFIIVVESKLYKCATKRPATCTVIEPFVVPSRRTVPDTEIEE